MRRARGVMIMLLLVMVGLSNPGWAQTLRFHRGNSGLVDNFVNRILILNGLPAVCTEGGLTIIHPDNLESWKRGELAFPDAGVSAAVHFNGRIWIGTNGKGLARFEESKWKSFATSDSGLGDNFVTALTVWGNRLLVGTREGLFFFDGLLWDKVLLENGRPYVVSALLTMNSIVYVGSNRGLLKLENRAVPVLTTVNAPFPSRITALAAENGILYAAHENGVMSFPPAGESASWTLESRTGARIVDLIPNQGVLLVGTSRGLFVMKPDGSVRPASFAGMPPGVPTITALVRGGGYIWIGLEGEGILRVPDHEPVIEGSEIIASVGSRPANQRNMAAGEVRSSPATPVVGKTEPVSIKFSNVRVFTADEAGTPAVGVTQNNVGAVPSGVLPIPANGSQPPSTVPGWGTVPVTPGGAAAVRVVVPAPSVVPSPAIVAAPVAPTPSASPSAGSAPARPAPVTPTTIPGWGMAVPPSGSPPPVIRAPTTLPPSSAAPVAPVAPTASRVPVPTTAAVPTGWGVIAGAVPPANSGTPTVPPAAPSSGVSAAPTPPTGLPGWGAVATPAGSPPPRINPPASPTPSPASPVASGSGVPISASSGGALPGWGAVTVSSGNAVSVAATQAVSWSRSIWPMIQRSCAACHTSGTGSYFPLADQENVKAYFRREGMKRYDAAAQPGRGMSGVVTAADTQLLRNWVTGGMSE